MFIRVFPLSKKENDKKENPKSRAQQSTLEQTGMITKLDKKRSQAFDHFLNILSPHSTPDMKAMVLMTQKLESPPKASQSHTASACLHLQSLPQNQTQKFPILVYFHGGAFFLESAVSLHAHCFLNQLVSEAQVVAVSVEYRLAPENPLPLATEDSRAALQWVASHSNNQELDGKKDPWLAKFGDFDRLYIGGNIAHNLAMKAGFESSCGGVKFLRAFLSYTYFWGSKPIGSEPKGEDLEKTLEYKAWEVVYPSAPEGIDNPMVNPAGEGAPSLAGLGCSKLLMCFAGKNQLRDRGIWYCDLVRESGWKGEVELFELEGEEHCFHLRSETETGMLRDCSNAWLLF